MSCAVDWFVYGTGLSHAAALCMKLMNESLFNQWLLYLVVITGSTSDIVRYSLVIVIFYCANTTALHMPDWKFSEGGR